MLLAVSIIVLLQYASALCTLPPPPRVKIIDIDDVHKIIQHKDKAIRSTNMMSSSWTRWKNGVHELNKHMVLQPALLWMSVIDEDMNDSAVMMDRAMMDRVMMDRVMMLLVGMKDVQNSQTLIVLDIVSFTSFTSTRKYVSYTIDYIHKELCMNVDIAAAQKRGRFRF